MIGQMFGQAQEMAVERQVVNVASVAHRSPFRYPGGKTWLVPHTRQWLKSLPSKPPMFCEPFCGGAIVSLSVLFEGLVDNVVLVELDDDVASVWQTMLNGDAEKLTDRIASFELSRESVRAVLEQTPSNLLDKAFRTILRNRVQRGGILAAGASLMKHGENGRGLASRWYAKTLQKRIKDIASKSDCISFVHGDGIEFMRQNARRPDAAFCIDPPYTVAGRRLYTHSEVDHEELFCVASTLQGDFLMTYDDAEPIRHLAARFNFDVHSVPMKNTHHRIMAELLIGRDLGWARTQTRQLRQDPLFEL